MSRRNRKVQRAEQAPAQQAPAAVWRRPELWICVALLAATFAVYGQAARFDYVNYDDPDYVSGNPHTRAGFTMDGVKWALTSGEAANWFPLTRLSFLLETQLLGLDAGPHHVVNAVLHAVAAILVFLVFNYATGSRWASGFAAGLFALHPLHVESVAWIAERKDVLSAVFWFLTLGCYVKWVRGGGRGWYGLGLAAFVCGWLSKPMVVTLPVVLLLLDVWPLARIRPFGKRIAEKAPFFAISVAGAAVTYLVQKNAGAVQTLESTPLSLRIENAPVSTVVYIWKTIWPSRLAVFYPYTQAAGMLWKAAAAAAALVAITIWTSREIKARPYLAMGWWWLLITILPVIGIVQVGHQARADRYMYIPMVGLSIMAAWGAKEWLGARPRWRVPAAALACAALLASGAAAWAQVSYWANSETLWVHTLAVTNDNGLAEHNLGAYLVQQQGKVDEALPHLERAVRLIPDSPGAHTDLGEAFFRKNRLDEAIAEHRKAIRIDPRVAITHYNLGNALNSAGRAEEALAEYRTALRLEPVDAGVRANLQAVINSPAESALVHYNMGLTLAKQGHPAEAVAEFEAALARNPDYAEAENNLGAALRMIPERSGESLAHFRAAVRLRPDFEEAQYNLGIALANTPNGLPEALQHFERALVLRPDPELRALVERLRRGQ